MDHSAATRSTEQRRDLASADVVSTLDSELGAHRVEPGNIFVWNHPQGVRIAFDPDQLVGGFVFSRGGDQVCYPPAAVASPGTSTARTSEGECVRDVLSSPAAVDTATFSTTDDSLFVQWQPASPSTDGYTAVASATEGSGGASQVCETAETECTFTGLDPAQSYVVEVSASEVVDGGDVITADPTDTVPQSPAVQAPGVAPVLQVFFSPGQFRFSWDLPATLPVSYSVYRIVPGAYDMAFGVSVDDPRWEKVRMLEPAATSTTFTAPAHSKDQPSEQRGYMFRVSADYPSEVLSSQVVPVVTGFRAAGESQMVCVVDGSTGKFLLSMPQTWGWADPQPWVLYGNGKNNVVASGVSATGVSVVDVPLTPVNRQVFTAAGFTQSGGGSAGHGSPVCP